MVSDWNCLKYFCVFFTVIIRCTGTFWSLCIFPSATCFIRQWLCNMWPIQLDCLLFIVCTILLSPLTLCNTSSFSHNWSIWCSPSFSNTTSQNFPGISDPLSEVSKSQHHTKLCSKRSKLLISSIHIFSLNKRVQEYQSALCATNEGRWHKTASKYDRRGSHGRQKKRRNHVIARRGLKWRTPT
jgi:hypothetical protein